MRGLKTTIGSSQQRSRRLCAAFTLVEALMVVAVIGILAALLLPTLTRAGRMGNLTICRNNVRQIALGMANFADDNSGYLPWASARSDSNREADFLFGGPDSPADLANPSAWDNNGFSFHPESGALFPYMTGQPRVESHKDSDRVEVPSMRCPDSGRLGRALNVNYSMNGWMDPAAPDVSSKGVSAEQIPIPSKKILLLNERPDKMASSGMTVDATDGRGQLQMHNGRGVLGFSDTHVETKTAAEFLLMLSPSKRDFWFNPSK